MRKRPYFHRDKRRKMIDIDEKIEQTKDNFYWYNERFG